MRRFSCTRLQATRVRWACSSVADNAAVLRNRIIEHRMRGESPPIDRMWREFINPMKAIEEFCHSSARRRHASLASMLAFTADHNVLAHSLLRRDENAGCWNTSREFSRLVRVGDALVRSEVTRRLMSAFPELTKDEVVALASDSLSPAKIAGWYDAVCYKALCRPKAARRSSPPCMDMKVHVVLATVAELNWFVVKTKATDRTQNNALFPPSDALILHVIANHIAELTLGSLAFEDFLIAIASAKHRWYNMRCSRAEQFLRSAWRSKRLDIGTAALEPPVSQVAGAGPACAHPVPNLAAAPTRAIVTEVRPVLRWDRMDTGIPGLDGPGLPISRVPEVSTGAGESARPTADLFKLRSVG